MKSRKPLTLLHPQAKTLIHPVFHYFPRLQGVSDGSYFIDFLGVKINRAHSTFFTHSPIRGTVSPEYPKPDTEQYFEWVTLLEAVLRAEERFVMFELGAARATWLVRAAAAIRSTSNVPVHLVAVEGGERFQFISENFQMNGLNPDDHDLHNAVVTEEDGYAYFLDSDNPAAGYGDRVVGTAKEFAKVKKQLQIKEEELEAGSRASTNREGLTCIRVPSVSLPTLLEKWDAVDLIHMDVQNYEHYIIKHSIEEVSQKVKTLCIGTHSLEAESALREMLTKHGWLCRYDFPRRTTWATEWGTIPFGDGCQVWLNQSLASTKAGQGVYQEFFNRTRHLATELTPRPSGLTQKQRERNDERLLALRDRHKGKRCFIVSPSKLVQPKDLDLLQNEITIASNDIYRFFGKTGWRPTYYNACSDTFVSQNKEAIAGLKMEKVCIHNMVDYFWDDPGAIYLNSKPSKDDAEEVALWGDLQRGTNAEHSVVNLGIKTAWYMGIREIYVLGYTHEFSDHSRRVRGMLLSDLLNGVFAKSRRMLEKTGGTIKNLSSESRLEVWDRARIEDLF